MDKSTIKHVTISKLWGIKTISTDLDENVNIFIGINGSSKTTFLNLIEAALLVDLKVFYAVDFEYIQIDFINANVLSVKVAKQEKDGDYDINYYFDNEELISIPCSEVLIQRSSYRVPIRYRESLNMVRDRMKNIVNISWLSVNRDNSELNDYDRHEFERTSNMVDIKLQELEHNLVLYQLQLESESNKLADRFKENVLSLMLYDEGKDYFKSDEISQFSTVDTKAMQADLFKAFSALGVAKDKSTAIQTHVKKIKGVVDNINNRQLSIDDAFVLALINRTFSLIDISKTHESQKKEIFAQIEKFKSCLHKFMPDKEFNLNKNNEGRLEVELKEGNSDKSISFDLTSLSSGEKQLFILMTESLLQKSIPHLFIADEPELSLHIGWQKLIIGELLEMNPNAQIIVATHSPEIAGSYPNNVVNMRKITSYHE